MRGCLTLHLVKPAGLLLLAICVSRQTAAAQARDSTVAINKLKPDSSESRPEVFTSGFFDIVNNGQVNASARLIRLQVGEKGKFSIPLSIYSGVSSNNFQQNQTPPKTNDQLFNNFINPLAGITNLFVERIKFHDTNSLTRTGMIYSFGERVLTGYKSNVPTQTYAGKPVNFLNSYLVIGGYFQTGAWERSNNLNVGVFWLGLRYIGTYTNSKELKQVMPSIETNGFYHGYSIGGGIEINKVVNMKLIYYKYIKAPEMDYALPIYQFSFNYYMK
jgi:hypothetical protein